MNIYKYIFIQDPKTFSKPFLYTEDTLNGIKKMTEKEEVLLCTKTPSKEVINLFTIIYIILEKNYLHIPTANLIINLSQSIMPEFNINSISKL